MSEDRPEIRIPLPRNPILRTLLLSGNGALFVVMLLPVVIQALAAPAWLGTLAVLLAILFVPLVTLGAWLRKSA